MSKVNYSPDFTILLSTDKRTKSVVINDDTLIINENAFSNSSLGKVVFPAGLKIIKNNAFENTSLESINILNEIILGEYTFMNNRYLKNVELNCKKIPYECFAWAGCERGVNIILMNTEMIEDSAFVASKINSISLPDTLKILEEKAFYKVSFKNPKLILPKNVEFIGRHAFKGTNLTDIFISENIKDITDLQYEPNIKIHMSKKTFDRLNLESDKNVVLYGIDELIDSYSFKELNKLMKNDIKQSKEKEQI